MVVVATDGRAGGLFFTLKSSCSTPPRVQLREQDFIAEGVNSTGFWFIAVTLSLSVPWQSGKGQMVIDR